MSKPAASPIQFRDDDGVQWTVTRHDATQPELVRLLFVSEAGEGRSTDVIPLNEEGWAELNELAWRSILRGAPPARED